MTIDVLEKYAWYSFLLYKNLCFLLFNEFFSSMSQVSFDKVAFKQISPVVAFTPFQENHHTGCAIARWAKAVLLGLGMTVSCVTGLIHAKSVAT